MRKIRFSILLALTAVLVLALPASAARPVFPEVIPLPTGFRPEGIAIGRGHTFYVGSLADGRVLQGDLRTGETTVLVDPQTGTLSVGMDYDERSNALFVAGGPTGMARVFDASTGALLESYQLTTPGNFINDVIVTREAAYFTSSSEAVLYVLPFGPGGSLPDPDDFVVLPLSGDWMQIPNAFNANGIEATANGEWLIVVNSTAGILYRVDPDTGVAEEIDLGGQSVSAGDGLLLRGSLLYVVRNQLDQIVVIDLNADLSAGTVVDVLTDSDLAVPTTIGAFGNALYAVNAKFGRGDPATLGYEVVRVELR